MGNIKTLDFGEDFIKELVDYIDEHYGKFGKDLSRLAIVFGGKRPSLFVKRQLSQRMAASFYPPKFFSMDEFIGFVARKKENFKNCHDLDQCYLLYQLTKMHASQILKGRETFAQFLPWAREILSFIDHVDLENVSDDKLRNIEANAQIGYSVPQDINQLLESIVLLRKAYHEAMRQSKNYSRGFLYRFASQSVGSCDFSEFDQIIFCNFFYFHQSEAALVKNLYDRNLASFVFQGAQDRWSTLKRTSELLGQAIREKAFVAPLEFELNLYSAFDGHAGGASPRDSQKNRYAR